MIVVVLGFHKSGTTLIARTLHEAGINMGTDCAGSYPKCKYEDPRVLKIKNDILYGGEITPSYELPTSHHRDQTTQIQEYIQARELEAGSWGFKVPDITLCYGMWRHLLPEHVVIGIRRSLEGLIDHYSWRTQPPDPAVIKRAWMYYNYMLRSEHIPTVRFEDIIENGIEPIETIVGMRLPDVREKHGPS